MQSWGIVSSVLEAKSFMEVEHLKLFSGSGERFSVELLPISFILVMLQYQITDYSCHWCLSHAIIQVNSSVFVLIYASKYFTTKKASKINHSRNLSRKPQLSFINWCQAKSVTVIAWFQFPFPLWKNWKVSL